MRSHDLSQKNRYSVTTEQNSVFKHFGRTNLYMANDNIHVSVRVAEGVLNFLPTSKRLTSRGMFKDVIVFC